eukprot:12886437-Prorocentrum_lima.AAC.1
MQPRPLFPSSWAPRAHYVPLQVPIGHPQYGPSFGHVFAPQGGYPSPTMSMGYEGVDYPMGEMQDAAHPQHQL